MASTEIEQIEVRLVIEAIQARYGYDFRSYSPESIARRVLAAQGRTGVAHLGELIHRLLIDPAFFRVVLSTLTVQVTEMFRDPEFYAVFRRDVVPRLRTYPALKFWHAGCATGEEAYSMAILLREEGLYERSQIYGTDLDVVAVERARSGIYSEDRAEEFSRNYLAAGGKSSLFEYCTAGYQRMTINESIRRNLVFFQHDLAADFALGEMQVIFCRNVALYFDDRLRLRVFEMLLSGLVPGGYLCLGASEVLPLPLRALFEEVAPLSRIFRRRGPQ